MAQTISKLDLTKLLWQKGWRYGTVGAATYILDLLLIFLSKEYLGATDPVAIGVGFFVAVTVNFLLSYHWVFKGTVRSKKSGYLNFCILAVVGLAIIIPSTLFVQTALEIDIYYARTIVATVVGFTVFFINCFFNFKILH